MKKEIIRRGLIGLPIGIAISYIITIIVSLAAGDGMYHPVVPELVEQMGSEMTAIVVQLLLSAMIGTLTAASSIIWEMEEWSIAKQTGIYFCTLSFIMLPIAYFLHWMERSFIGFLLYFSSFTLMFLLIWVIQYIIFRKNVKKINDKIKGERSLWRKY